MNIDLQNITLLNTYLHKITFNPIQQILACTAEAQDTILFYQLAKSGSQFKFIQLFEGMSRPSGNKSALKWSPNGTYLALGSSKVEVWFLDNGRIIPFKIFNEDYIQIKMIQWSQDSLVYVCGGINSSNSVKVRNIETGLLKEILLPKDSTLSSISFDPFGKYLLFLLRTNIIEVYNTGNYEKLKQIKLSPSFSKGLSNNSEPRIMDWSPDYADLVVPSLFEQVIPVAVNLSRAQNFTVKDIYEGHAGTIFCAKFNPKLYRNPKGQIIKILALGDARGAISIWKIINNKQSIEPNGECILFLNSDDNQEVVEELQWIGDQFTLLINFGKDYIQIVRFDNDSFGLEISENQTSLIIKNAYGAISLSEITYKKIPIFQYQQEIEPSPINQTKKAIIPQAQKSAFSFSNRNEYVEVSKQKVTIGKDNKKKIEPCRLAHKESIKLLDKGINELNGAPCFQINQDLLELPALNLKGLTFPYNYIKLAQNSSLQIKRITNICAVRLLRGTIKIGQRIFHGLINDIKWNRQNIFIYSQRTLYILDYDLHLKELPLNIGNIHILQINNINDICYVTTKGLLYSFNFINKQCYTPWPIPLKILAIEIEEHQINQINQQENIQNNINKFNQFHKIIQNFQCKIIINNQHLIQIIIYPIIKRYIFNYKLRTWNRIYFENGIQYKSIQIMQQQHITSKNFFKNLIEDCNLKNNTNNNYVNIIQEQSKLIYYQKYQHNDDLFHQTLLNYLQKIKDSANTTLLRRTYQYYFQQNRIKCKDTREKAHIIAGEIGREFDFFNEQSTIFTYKALKKQLFISRKTKSYILASLLKRAFQLSSEIRHLRMPNGQIISLGDIFAHRPEREFQLVLEDDSDQANRSEVCSQKLMSRKSGRKQPPSQKQLLESKFYIDDLQFFMAEVKKKSNRLYGIIFFGSKKKLLFLGKKILRELIFEFDKIQFFYALHPIKMHTNYALLGELLIFSIFRGKNLIFQREFAEQITAAEEIIGYIKGLNQLGVLSFDKNHNQQKQNDIPEKQQHRNLIDVYEQRSFDEHLDVDQKKLVANEVSNRTTEVIKLKSSMPIKQEFQPNLNISPITKIPLIAQQSPVKSPLTNEISFENETYQPEWFFNGDKLTRLERALLSALIKTNDESAISFCNSLNMVRTHNKQVLNVNLMKTFLKFMMKQKFTLLTQQQMFYIQVHQQNRQSYVFSALLKLHKFGDIGHFMSQITQYTDEKYSPNSPCYQYSDIARMINQRNKGFKIQQVDKQIQELASPKKNVALVGKDQTLEQKNLRIANKFHLIQMPTLAPHQKFQLSQQYNEADTACIKQLINKNDAFIIQNFFPAYSYSKYTKLSPLVVKKYMKSIQPRYSNIRERTNLDEKLASKLQKLQVFMSLLYFCYKQRIITRKHLKQFLYLYSWCDLNILGIFELYLHDRHIQEFIDSLYYLEYNYYSNNKFGIDVNSMEDLNMEIQSQLIILFLFGDYIHSVQQRIYLQKWILAGDNTIYKLYHDYNINNSQFIKKIIQVAKDKKIQYTNMTKSQSYQEFKAQEKRKQRCQFLQEIIHDHFKFFKKQHLVKQCILNDQKEITSIFDQFDQDGLITSWKQSFSQYIQRLDDIHQSICFKLFAEKSALFSFEDLKDCNPQHLKGVYQVYMVTKDVDDAIDSLAHLTKTNPPSYSP